MAEGKTNKEVANILKLSLYTVESHRGNILEKLNLHSVPELILYAVRKGSSHEPAGRCLRIGTSATTVVPFPGWDVTQAPPTCRRRSFHSHHPELPRVLARQIRLRRPVR